MLLRSVLFYFPVRGGKNRVSNEFGRNILISYLWDMEQRITISYILSGNAIRYINVDVMNGRPEAFVWILSIQIDWCLFKILHRLPI